MDNPPPPNAHSVSEGWVFLLTNVTCVSVNPTYFDRKNNAQPYNLATP